MGQLDRMREMSLKGQWRQPTLHVVDDDLPTCEGLCALFALEGLSASFSTNGDDFIALFMENHFDIVLLNLRVSMAEQPTVLKQVMALGRNTDVVMVANKPNLSHMQTALLGGACAQLTKPIDATAALRLVRAILRRQTPVSANFGAMAFEELTLREVEVLNLIVGGYSNKEAGAALGISPRTVEVHRFRAQHKLGVRNAAELCRIYLHAKWASDTID